MYIAKLQCNEEKPLNDIPKERARHSENAVLFLFVNIYSCINFFSQLMHHLVSGPRTSIPPIVPSRILIDRPNMSDKEREMAMSIASPAMCSLAKSIPYLLLAV